MPELSTIEDLLKAANSSTENDTSVNASKRIFLQESAAKAFFEQTKSRMLDIREWTNKSSATEYELFDESGSVVQGGPISIGHLIRIGLYGGGKYDWVRVISVTDQPHEFIITVQPSHDPTDRSADRSSTSHFFVPDARNNFCLQLNDKTVAFYVIGLNEKQNTKFTDSLIESARNAAVANVGYYTGLQKAVWKEFASNFVSPDKESEG